MTTERPRGFLPFDTNRFDRVFFAVMTGVAWHLVFLKYFEDNASIWVAFVIWLAWLVVVVRKG